MKGMGNAGKGNPQGQKVLKGSKGGKAPHLDKMAAEHSKSMGSAKPADKNIGNHCNTPDGQKIF